MLRASQLILPLLALLQISEAVPAQICKCTPGDPCWPSDSDFDALNKTVSGRLIRGLPPASVCYSDQPNFDATACLYVGKNWFNSTFHASDPISVGWPWWANNTCPPIYPNGTSVTGDPDAGKKGCHIGGYPALALNATEPSDIQAVIKFANARNIRLNIKSTGHSFQGRSTAFGSVSIWTHNFRGAQWHDDFQPEGCSSENSPQMAATFAAGERDRNVYEFVAPHRAVVVGGSAQDVGIMGWFTGGGHGPLSSSYGMGVDNVLQFKIVTPIGDFLTANQFQNQDLFWAVRGGGGGTFGVVTEVTMKAYPSPRASRQELLLASLPNTNFSAFFDVVARIFTYLPRLKAGGLQGYINVYPPQYVGFDGWTLLWALNIYDKPNGTIESLFAPIAQFLDPINGTAIFYNTTVSSYPDYFTMWNNTIGDESVALGGAALGSRLMPESAFSDAAVLSGALQNITGAAVGGSPAIIEAALVANNNHSSDNEVSITPAWRDAVAHLIVTDGFPDFDTFPQAKPTLDWVTYQRVGKMRELAPDSGAYINEGDPYDPNWQEDFFGGNYNRLLSIKRKYDPNSALWCLACVGNEDWVEVGQQSGRLCKSS